MAKKEWEIAFGQRGANSGDSISDIVRRDMVEREQKQHKREDEIENLEHVAKIEELKGKGKESTPITLKPIEIDVQSGEKMAQQRADSLEQRLAEEQRVRQEAERQLDQERMNNLTVNFTKQIDDLKKLMEGQGSTQSISEKLAEIKGTAGELGWGPQQQGGQVPSDVQIKLQEQDHRFKIEIEKMKDDRERRDKEWQVSMMKYGDDKAFKSQQLQQEVAANKERTDLLRGGLDTIGRIAGKAMVSNDGGGGIGQRVAKEYPLMADDGETGEFSCPGCGSKLYLAPDAVEISCPKCGSVSSFTRTKPESPPKEQKPVEEGKSSEVAQPV